MEPATIVIICATVFGVAALLSAFVRQLLLSRDKRLNDKAQRRALNQEVRELEKLRTEMIDAKRLDSHAQVLGANKDAIEYLDKKIEDLLQKKFALIERYAQVAVKESSAMIQEEPSSERKAICDKLKEGIDSEIASYDKELEQLQSRRASLWDTHKEYQDALLQQEGRRNKNLDALYLRHCGLLEKMYVRHNIHTERVAIKSIEAGTQTFKDLIMAPIYALIKYFNPSKNIMPDKAQEEAKSREDVSETESEINEVDDMENMQFKDTLNPYK